VRAVAGGGHDCRRNTLGRLVHEISFRSAKLHHGTHAWATSHIRGLLVSPVAGDPVSLRRLVAEPVWLAHEDGREWSRFEAVANRCYAAMPNYSLCLHDRRRLPAQVLDAVVRTYPLTWSGHTPVEAVAYEDSQRFLRSVQPEWDENPGTRPCGP